MKTLEQIKNFTPKQRNEFIDEMIEMIEKYWFNISILGTLKYLTDVELTRSLLSKYTEALLMNKDYLTNIWLSKESSIRFLKSIKTAE